MRHKRLFMMAALCLAAYCAPGRAAVTEDSFMLRSTGDLIDLCTATPSDPMGTAALNFCQGFGVGVYRVLEEVDGVRKLRTFCMPDPVPTRNEALASFVQWAKANPDQLGTAPQDGIAAFLLKQYPCAHKK
jgi:Rap1a immunity proteins